MTINLQALKDEITNNPVSMSYPAFTAANDAAIADVINNADGTNPRTVDNDQVPSSEIRAATTLTAFSSGMNPSEESWFQWLTAGDVVAVTPDTKVNLAGIGGTSIWGGADATLMNARMAALMQRQGSRAEELQDTLGVSSVTPSDVANARQLP